MSLTALAACGGSSGEPAGPAGPPDGGGAPSRLTDVRHVFVIVLENRSYAATFGTPGAAPYLNGTLVPSGLLLTQYYGIAHNSLPNYIAMVSGVAPTRETQSDCGVYQDFAQTGVANDGQPVGRGCVYPDHVLTLADQLQNAGFSWRAYMEDMGNDPRREPGTCGHVPLGAVDRTQTATASDQYAARHNPFVYFHSIIDSDVCDASVVPLDALEGDLASADATPNFVFIGPNLCHDGHDTPCRTGEPGGLASADAFLRQWVPKVLASPAFQQDGLLVITFDEAHTSDASACCGEQSGPNTSLAGGSGPGGGRVGALLLSPFITAGTTSDVGYNHYSFLRSIEDAFGLGHLGYAAGSSVATFDVR